MKFDYLIIGQGLAGTLLVHALRKRGKSCMVLDNPEQPKASEVAAGVINPVVFRRLTKSWLIDELYLQLLSTYAELEHEFGTRLFYPLQIKKVLGKGENEFWRKKVADDKLQNYLLQEPEPISSPYIEAPFGVGTVIQSGRVDLSQLIESMRQQLQSENCIRFEKVAWNKLTLQENRVIYQDLEAQKVIFCEGHAVSQNPFFKNLQFKHTKGEMLRIKTTTYNENFILNKAMFLMPEGEQYYRLGATYDWNDLSTTPQEHARIELTEKLSTFFTGTYEVVDHQAGIRPTTHDRRPVLGLHPHFPQLGIFNGLGSKGTMLGPYFARQFARFLCDEDQAIQPEVNINRYFPERK
ncbi:NAD(P)/FAD-dependent oxidoreductase [Sunxiuqinia rutila]|uniref:NAD(P)/FAD-dependent oxidoreductase n=1 Tax=Sunxiuqinia rutila TaxID=1397841 RepID=UPI003D366522